ncbi:MAG: shikimate dehydrogenase [Actinobacteria bacterium]|nr:shikimate dehydrogenase [Actinomycetota bacterium]
MKHAGVAGYPIEHSLSPLIHKAGYLALGLDWNYEKYLLKEDELSNFVNNRDKDLVGLSLTMPLKEKAIQVSDVVTEMAQKVNSANTLIFKDGKIYSGNTDIYGIVQALKTNKKLDLSNPAIIGSGATARSSIMALKNLGAKNVMICARNDSTSIQVNDLANSLGLKSQIINWSDLAKAMNASTLISTLPSQALDKFAALGPENPGTLLDIAYDPWPSKVALEWIFRRGFVVSGLEMLLHQACMQFELMTGLKAPITQMRQALFKN